MTFAARLHAAVKAKGNMTVLGLDPKPAYVPSYFRQTGQVARDILCYNRRLIDCAKDLVAVVKPQLAYYEALGQAGLETFSETIRYAKRQGLLVIVDGKRNDIGSTAAAYAAAYLGEAAYSDAVDALTINPYLGFDGVAPFLEAADAHDKGVFALVRTSNPSAVDLQDLTLDDGRRVYEAVADAITAWGEPYVRDGYAPLGAVVGATWPEQAEALRERLPHAVVLVPGYGAQGGGADDAVKAVKRDGRGAIVNASRSLMLAYEAAHASTPRAFDEATRSAMVAMRDALNAALTRAGKASL